MSRDFTIKNAIHRDPALSVVLDKIGGKYYFAMTPILPSSPTITTTTTTDGNWTAIATGITGVLQWKLTELNGNDFHYAFVAAPGNNFSVGFGVVGYSTNPSAIYVKRPGSSNITIKYEAWAI